MAHCSCANANTCTAVITAVQENCQSSYIFRSLMSRKSLYNLMSCEKGLRWHRPMFRCQLSIPPFSLSAGDFESWECSSHLPSPSWNSAVCHCEGSWWGGKHLLPGDCCDSSNPHWAESELSGCCCLNSVIHVEGLVTWCGIGVPTRE